MVLDFELLGFQFMQRGNHNRELNPLYPQMQLLTVKVRTYYHCWVRIYRS